MLGDLDQLVSEGRSLADDFGVYLIRTEDEFLHDKLPKPLQAMALSGFKVATGRDIAGWKQLNAEWAELVRCFEDEPQEAAKRFQSHATHWINLFQSYLDFAIKAPTEAARFFPDEQTKREVDELFVQSGVSIIKRHLSWLRRMSKLTGSPTTGVGSSVDQGMTATLGLVSDAPETRHSLAIEASGLRKAYGSVHALDDISLRVPSGMIYGLLGPNGAGKSTLIECLEGLRLPDSGSIKILGLTYRDNSRQIKQKLGIQLQSTGFLPTLTVLETLRLYSSFFEDGIGVREAAAWVDLEDKLMSQVRALSGGQRQRLSLALAVLSNPDILFLDEPTTGLDPHARKAIWDMIAEFRGRGKTIFLTTHYMEEAELLCDRLAIQDRGRIIEEGTPAELIKKHVGDRSVEFTFKGTVDEAAIGSLPGVQKTWLRAERAVVLSSDIPATLVPLLVDGLPSATIDDLVVRRGTLEDVFLKLTDRGLVE